MDKMEYIKLPLSGKLGTGKFTLVDGDYDGEYYSQYTWYLMPNGYVARARIEEESSKRNSYIYLHKEVCKSNTGLWVDHINRDKLDNRSCNLRLVTPSENSRNRKIPTSKPKGTIGYTIVKDGRAKKYKVRIKGSKVRYFYTAEEAARYYDNLAIAEYGYFASLNF